MKINLDACIMSLYILRTMTKMLRYESFVGGGDREREREREREYEGRRESSKPLIRLVKWGVKFC